MNRHRLVAKLGAARRAVPARGGTARQLDAIDAASGHPVIM
ncbi:hypothetical protein [Pilimelia terevasa]|nr:hypothetical protein [Pilimelia terevasa]